MKRSGLITTKIGMTRLYDDGGVAHPVTVLSVLHCHWKSYAGKKWLCREYLGYARSKSKTRGKTAGGCC